MARITYVKTYPTAYGSTSGYGTVRSPLGEYFRNPSGDLEARTIALYAVQEGTKYRATPTKADY